MRQKSFTDEFSISKNVICIVFKFLVQTEILIFDIQKNYAHCFICFIKNQNKMLYFLQAQLRLHTKEQKHTALAFLM
jgi:hypothetical protein